MGETRSYAYKLQAASLLNKNVSQMFHRNKTPPVRNERVVYMTWKVLYHPGQEFFIPYGENRDVV